MSATSLAFTACPDQIMRSVRWLKSCCDFLWVKCLQSTDSGIQTEFLLNSAAFLSKFPKYKWCHLDIAGVANSNDVSYIYNGATGYGIRLFVSFLKEYNKLIKSTKNKYKKLRGIRTKGRKVKKGKKGSGSRKNTKKNKSGRRTFKKKKILN